MSVLDPRAFLGKIKGASIFFQFAGTDEYVTEEAAGAFYQAANPHKQMATYNADYSLAGNEVEADRVNWLIRELGLAR